MDGRATFRDTAAFFAYIYATRLRGSVCVFPTACTHTRRCMRIRVHTRGKLQSRVRYGMRYVQLRHKEPSHASFIYYSRSHAADRRIRNRASSRSLFVLSRLPTLPSPLRLLFLPARVILLFFLFLFAHILSPGLISRGRGAQTANILAACHVRTCAAISSARQDLLAHYLPPPSRGHSRDCFPSSVIKLNFPAGGLVLTRKRPEF